MYSDIELTFLCSIGTHKSCVPSNYIFLDEFQNRKHWLVNDSANEPSLDVDSFI